MNQLEYNAIRGLSETLINEVHYRSVLEQLGYDEPAKVEDLMERFINGEKAEVPPPNPIPNNFGNANWADLPARAVNVPANPINWANRRIFAEGIVQQAQVNLGMDAQAQFGQVVFGQGMAADGLLRWGNAPANEVPVPIAHEPDFNLVMEQEMRLIEREMAEREMNNQVPPPDERDGNRFDF
jgi:hypothetical protein